LPGFLKNGSDFLNDQIQKLIPPEKRRIVLICAAGGLVLVIGLGALMTNKSGKQAASRPRHGSGSDQRFAIPPEDLFLPDEPDFIPGVLLEREQRTSWTAQDAAVYWQDPLKNGEEHWREKVEAVIDEFMERVP
jgi:hypothetical protein